MIFTLQCLCHSNRCRRIVLDIEPPLCNNKTMKKLCECGCGGIVPIAKQTNKKIGHFKGQPIRFIRGHVKFNGGKATHSKGYILIKRPDHPRADKRGYVLEHILIVERILGKPLPPNACIHHINENPADNRPKNLIVCPDNTYHKLVHQRLRALKSCGYAYWRKCKFCGQYDDPKNLYIGRNNENVIHRECRRKYYADNREHLNELQRRRRANGKSMV
jgi:hypothetical protein